MRLLARTLSVAMVSVGLVVGGAASGQALDTWSTVVRCGLGYVCKITTDTTRGQSGTKYRAHQWPTGPLVASVPRPPIAILTRLRVPGRRGRSPTTRPDAIARQVARVARDHL